MFRSLILFSLAQRETAKIVTLPYNKIKFKSQFFCAGAAPIGSSFATYQCTFKLNNLENKQN